MKRLRWVLLTLYLLVIAAGLITALVTLEGGLALLIGLVLFTQGLFLAVRSDPRILVPVEPRRLVLPVIVAGFMLAILVAGLSLAMLEYLKVKDDDPMMAIWLIANIAGWALWTALFYLYCRRTDYLRAVRHMVLVLIGGSLLQLLATIPSHVVEIRRPGCLVGIGTMMGIMAGLLVLFWAFGPGILLLFWFETRRRMPGYCRACAYNLTGNVSGICPECGTAIASPMK